MSKAFLDGMCRSTVCPLSEQVSFAAVSGEKHSSLCCENKANISPLRNDPINSCEGDYYQRFPTIKLWLQFCSKRASQLITT